MQAKSIRQILDIKGHDIWSVGPEATVFNALQLMSDKEIGALVVLDGEKLVGIMTERDYARKVILLGKSSRETQVREIMSQKVYTIQLDQTIEEAIELMNLHNIRHLPVVAIEDEQHVLGMISSEDVVETIIP